MDVTNITVDDQIERMTFEKRGIFLKKPNDALMPICPVWTSSDSKPEFSGKEVEVQAFVTGFTDFITENGSFNTIVRSGNADIFDTFAMQRAIEYKWETYGLLVQNITTTIYILMVALFVLAVAFEIEGGHGQGKTIGFLVLASFLSLFIVMKELRDWDGDKNYFKKWANISDFAVVILIWVLAIWSIILFYLDLKDDLDSVMRKLCIALTVFLMLLNLLMYLSCYSFIGATLFIFYEVVHDFMPIFVIMLLCLCAYIMALRVILSGTPQVIENDGDFYLGEIDENYIVSAFEANTGSLNWKHYSSMFNTAFKFGFMADTDYTVPYGQQEGRHVALGVLTQILFYLYAITSNIILLNLLIAVMGDTFDRVKEMEHV
jgi:hypothetical protein